MEAKAAATEPALWSFVTIYILPTNAEVAPVAYLEPVLCISTKKEDLGEHHKIEYLKLDVSGCERDYSKKFTDDL